MLEVEKKPLKKGGRLHRLSPSLTSISLFLSLNLFALIHESKKKWKYKRKKKKRKEHLHYTTLKERKPSYCSPSLGLRSINAVFIGMGRFRRRDEVTRQKSTRGPTKMQLFYGISATKLGSIALNFGHMIRLASSIFCMYLILQYLDVYFSRYVFKYGIQCIF